MRYARKFAQAQKKEEQAIFECYYQATRLATMDGHKKNLELVRKNLIDGNNDLTIKVWEHFLNVCEELNVDLNPIFDSVKLHPVDPGKGNCYRIPSKEVDLIGHTKQRQRRRQWREKFRRELEQVPSNDIIRRLQQPKLRAV